MLMGAQVQWRGARARTLAERVVGFLRGAQGDPVGASSIDSLADSGAAGLESVIQFVRIDKVRLRGAQIASRVGLSGEQLAGTREKVVDYAHRIRSGLDHDEAPALRVVVDHGVAHEIELVEKI